MEEKNEARQQYLAKFHRENNVDGLFNAPIQRVGKHLVAEMKKEDLTYEQAYASLQYAFNLLKYESNFLKLQ